MIEWLQGWWTGGQDTDNMEEREIRELGRGTFGTAALIKRGQEYLVLKKMTLTGMNQRVIALQLQEVKLLKELSHTNIVSYKGCRLEGGDTLCLYMEFCEGGDMHMAIEERPEGQYFPQTVVQSWMRQISSALAYLHSKRILHRDLKPKNIFMSRNKNSLKVGDFGLARVFSSETVVTSTQLGTPAYMAPEIWLGRSYDEKADMYSLGACVFHVAALTHLMMERMQQQQQRQQRQRPPEQLLPTAFSAPLRSLISALLSLNPNDRPSAENVLRNEAALGPPSDQISIVVQDIHGNKLPMRVRPSTTVRDVKEEVHKSRGIEPSSVNVVKEGVTMQEDKTLGHYGVRQGEILRLISVYKGGMM